MKVLVDTSVLVAATVEKHSAHAVALPWLQRAKAGTITGLVAAHSLAELYSILTTLPIQPRILPAIAHQLIKHNILDHLEVVTLTKEDYAALIEYLSEAELLGGVTYDALILCAAWKANVDQVVTLNEKDFRRIYPGLSEKIVSP